MQAQAKPKQKSVQPPFTQYEKDRVDQELDRCGWNLAWVNDRTRLMVLRRLGLRK
jgi:hypothetical protein